MPHQKAAIDLLNSLLEAEQESLFRFMTDGSPYLGRASVQVRKTIAYIADADHRRAGELWRAIESLGGSPRRAALRPAEQFLSFLSLKFLLPKLLEAKAVLSERYRNARSAPAVQQCHSLEVIKRHLSEHAGELAMLQQAAEEVARS